MHKSENEKIDFILDEHERISRKQGSLCMALGKGFLVIAILCGVATFCVSGLYLKSLCLSVACCCGVFSRIREEYSVSDEADEAYSVTEQLTMTGINRIRQKINVHGIPVYLCEACGNPIPEARRKIFPGVTLCVECQAYQERQRKHYA